MSTGASECRCRVPASVGTSLGLVLVLLLMAVGAVAGEGAVTSSTSIHTHANDVAETYGVNLDAAGNLRDNASGTNAGWVNFAPAAGGLTFTPNAKRGREVWRIRLYAFPDPVGRNPWPWLGCTGCDGVFTDGDRYEASRCPLQPLSVIITHPSGSPVYKRLIISRHGAGQTIQDINAIDVPPPYLVQLLTPDPLCYALCPNYRRNVILDQDYFDRVRNARRGDGRYAQVKWAFWSCTAPTVTPCRTP